MPIILPVSSYSFMLRNIVYYSTRTAYCSIIIRQNFVKMNKSLFPPVVKDSLSNFLKPDARTDVPVGLV